MLLAAELIKDTQDYLDIHLDSTQNRLIRLDLLTATATLSVAIYTLVAGILHVLLTVSDMFVHVEHEDFNVACIVSSPMLCITIAVWVAEP